MNDLGRRMLPCTLSPSAFKKHFQKHCSQQKAHRCILGRPEQDQDVKMSICRNNKIFHPPFQLLSLLLKIITSEMFYCKTAGRNPRLRDQSIIQALTIVLLLENDVNIPSCLPPFLYYQETTLEPSSILKHAPVTVLQSVFQWKVLSSSFSTDSQ